MSNIKISQLPYIGNTGYTVTDIVPFVSYINPTGTTSETKIDDLKDYILENSFFLPLSGGTVTGDTIFQSGLTANTISATTYYNLPIVSDTYWTSGTTGTTSIKAINSTGLDSTGDRSVAWGNQTLASGNDSTAWGVQTSATTIGSTSQGYLTLASGDYSHAEGTSTIASGPNSHSEGNVTITLGDSSHAEGDNTQAIEDYSHAEGSYTVTYGTFSHAEGNSTKTGGNNGYLAISVASGLVTLDASYGDVSTDYPAGDYLYLNDISYDDSYTTSVFIIDSTSFNGTETEILLVDTSVATSTAVVGNINLNPANWTGDQVYGAPYSHAEGDGTTAIAAASHAEGAGTTASGNYSHAEGEITVAIGDYSHAEGISTQSIGDHSHAEGRQSISSGLYSHAEGESAVAIGISSHAEGNLTVAGWRAFTVTSVVAGLITISDNVDYSSIFNSGEVILDNIKYTNNAVVFTSPNFTIQLDDTTVNSGTYVADFSNLNSPLATNILGTGAHATGTGTKALGDFSETGGDTTLASGYGSHAEGSSTQATGDASHAEGNNTKSSGDHSHAEGYSTIASVSYSHAEGNQTTADGQYSHTEGFGSQTIGANSHAEGNSTIASGINSHAEGYGGGTIGNSSHSEGYITTSIGDYSHSEGYGTVSGWRAFGVTSVVGGLITISDNIDYTSQFTLGGGEVILDNNLYTYNTISYSAPNFTIQLDDVTVSTGSYVADYTNLNSASAQIVLGTGSHTEGNSNRSTGDYSHAEGQGTISIGQSSHSEGFLTKSIGIASHSEGYSTTSIGTYSHSAGYNAIASGDTSFIHSTNSVVGGDRSVVLGGQNITGLTNDTVYVPYLNLNYVPTLNNANTEILSRNSVGGQVEYTPLSAFTALDTYVTGFTYSPSTSTFTIKQNQGQSDLTATIDSVTGMTVNGDLTVTGNTSMMSVTATTVSASTLTLVSPNVPPTPSVSTPFIDDYTRGTLSPGGTPSLTYTNTNTGTGNATIVTNYLNIVNGGTAGQSYTTVPLSGFGSPFNPTLSSNNSLSTIEWTFNLRTNRASIFAGFGASSYAGAVVLAGSNTNLQSTGSGYALVYGTTGTRNWKLVKYNNGLAGTQTDIITGGLFSGNTNYVSARIVYTPSTNTWSYYFRDDGASAWGDPTTTSALIGSAVDSTYTSTLMSVFGVFFNYSTAASQNLQFDNLRVQQSVSPSVTTIDQLILKNNSGTDVFNVKDDGTTTMSGTVTSSVGFFGSFSGTHLGNGSSLTLGQSGIMVTGTSQLNLTSATTALTLIPGLSTTISVSGQTMVYIQTNGGVNTLATTTVGGTALDIAILVDGTVLAAGGYQRMYADNPTGVGAGNVTNWVANWNTSVILTLAAGSHTIEVDAVYVQGSSASVSGIANSIKQGTLTVMVLKNN